MSAVRRPIALIVDDDDVFAATLETVMIDDGYRSLRARSVEDARAMIEEHRIAIVLLDLELGEARGRHLLDDLAAMERVPPMLVVSGTADAAQIANEFGVGCVQKPFALDELQAAIDVTRDFTIRPTRKIATVSGTRRVVALPPGQESMRNKR